MYPNSNYNPLNNSRREILWNIKQPGDPYDITKSMIKRLPGEEKLFMGDNLQIVCLFQAAQIQRLSLYLNQYILKYRQIERQSLDRHSYEIQIKQLTQRLSQSDSQRKQSVQTIRKLKEFFQKQSKELEEYKQSQKSLTGTKYNEALKQLDSFMYENNRLKSQNSNLQIQIQQLNARLSTIELSKNQEIERIKRQYGSFDREKQELKFKYQSEIRNIDMELKRCKQENYTLLRKIQILQNTVREYSTKIGDSSSKNDAYFKIERELVEAQNAKVSLRQQIERLTLIIQEKSSEATSLKDQLRLKQQQLFKYKSEFASLTYKIQSYEGHIKGLEENLSTSNVNQAEQQRLAATNKKMQEALNKLSQQIDRLNNVLKQKVNQNQELIKRLRQYEYQMNKIEILKRQNQSNRRQFQQRNRRMSDYEVKIAVLSQQIERLNGQLRKKLGDGQVNDQRLQQSLRENQQLKGRIKNLQMSFTQQLRSKVSNYEESILTLRKENDEFRNRLMQSGEQSRRVSEYENKIALLSQQIQRLNNVLEKISQERNGLTQQVLELPQLKSTLYNFETRNKSILNQNQLLKAQLNQFSQQGRRVEEYQRKLGGLSMQIQRLNSVLGHKIDESRSLNQNLKYKENQNQGLRRQLLQFSQNSSIIQQRQLENNNLRQKLDSVFAQLTKAQDENSSLRSALRQLESSNFKLSQYQQKIVFLSQEIERLNEILAKMKQQNETLRSQNRIIGEYELKISSYEARIVTYQRQISTYSQQIQSLNEIYQQTDRAKKDCETRLNQQSGDLQRRNFQLQQNLGSLTVELQHKSKYLQNYEQNINQLNGNLRETERALSEYSIKMVTLSNQVQRLNEIIKKFQQQNGQLSIKIQKYARFQEQVSNDHQSTQKRLSDYENRIALFGQQIQHLNQLLQDKGRQLNSLQTKFNQIRRVNEELTFKLRSSEENNKEYEIRLKKTLDEKQKLNQGIKNYQMNGSELVNKVRQYEASLADYRDKMMLMSVEIDRLNDALRKLNGENQQLKRKLQDYIKMQQQFANDHGLINKKLSEYQAKISLLSQQIQRLNTVLRTAASSKQELNLKLQNYMRLQQQWGNESSNINRKVADYQTKMTGMVQQIERLNQMLRQCKSDNEQLNISIHQSTTVSSSFERKLSDYENKLGRTTQQIDRISELLRAANSQNEQLKIKLQNYGRLQQQLSADQSSANRKISEYQAKIALLSQQIERLNNGLRTVTSQNHELTVKVQSYIRLEQKLSSQSALASRKISDYQDKLNRMSQQIQRLKEVLQKSTSQNQELTRKIQNYIRLQQQFNTDSSTLSRRVSEYEQKLALISQQLDRVDGLLRRATGENEQLSNKLQNYIKLEQQFNNDQSSLNRKIAEYENKIAILSQQIERLKQSLQVKIRQNNGLKGQIAQSAKDLEEVKYRNRTLEQSYQELQLKYRKTIEDIQKLNRILNDSNNNINSFHEKARQYLEQIQRLNNTLRIKVEETRRWEIRCEELQNAAKGERGQWQYKYQQIQKILKTERSQWQLKSQNYEQMIRAERAQWENKVKQLENILSQERSQMKSLKESYQGLQQQYNRSKNSLKEYEVMITKLNEEFSRLHIIIKSQKEKCDEYDLYKQRVGQHESQMAVQIKILQEEIKRLRVQLQSRDAHIRDLTDHVCRDLDLQKRIKEDLSLFVVLFCQIESLRNRLKSKQAQIETVRSSLTVYMSK